jgi:hypothetical protein
LHDRFPLGEQVLAALGDSERPTATVGWVGPTLDVSTLLQNPDGLRSRLTADGKSIPKIAHGVGPGGDRAQREMVNGAVIGVTLTLKPPTRLLNQGSEPCEQQKSELRTSARHGIDGMAAW